MRRRVNFMPRLGVAGPRLGMAAGAAVALATTLSAQQPLRRATNIAALKAHPAFYNLRPIVVVGKVTVANNGDVVMTDEGGAMRILSKGAVPDGLVEVRGEFWDIGRMNANDPRLAAYDVPRTFHVDPEAAWPRPGQVTAIVASVVAETTPATAPTIRAMVLSP